MLNIELTNHSYPIQIGQNLLVNHTAFSQYLTGKQVLIVTNTTIADGYLAKLQQTLQAYDTHHLILPDGETYKTLATVQIIWDKLLQLGFNRQATLIALGGGVVGDMTGFAAATYLRGIAFIQVPTSLLAQVDASIGGKTGVNHTFGKNMIGSFHQPNAVIIDVDTLDTLPEREYRAGLVEIIKHALIKDKHLLQHIEQQISALAARDKQVLIPIIQRSCEIKAQVVMDDEREQSDQRMLLNFGHTFAHAIETLTNYQTYLHGEAVAIGMMNALQLSLQYGNITSAEIQFVRSLLDKLGLPTKLPASLSTKAMVAAMQHDKKLRDDGLRLIILEKLGQAIVVTGCQTQQIERALTA